jgi:hypothetical protein
MAHGKESAEKKHGGGEWFGPKMKQFLKASGLTMFVSTAVFGALGVPIVPAYIAAQGFVGGGLSMWGWNAAQNQGKKGGH